MINSPESDPSPLPPCQHQRQQFRKAAGSSQALLFCLDCDWQMQMSFEQAMKRVLAEDVVPKNEA